MAEELVTKGDHSLTFSRSLVLGSGTYGDVYGGKYNGKDVAIKRVQLRHINLNEDQSLQLDHDNVVKLHHCRDNEDFRFYVLERCAANLEQFCKGDYEGPMPSDAEVLYQLATGLEYIHAKRLHRDIKPENILISEPDPNVQIKWADFGLSKALNINGSCSMSGVRGTNNWIAPEIFRLRENPGGRSSPSSDIFSTGLVFFYFLKRGVHPFGKDREIESNIQNKKQANIHGI
ncbi:serine/threonine-protein kinase/endoribonuclease IRE1-like [Daphnia carinata]|uniref:serine/threonine-protein kinase/endoribonuclease IRE1-like n=1 Tax=Daphnia carinata TaxID=120202 RepID=UPI00257DDA17|nr:serine/threonine-protein kinase/endoribonuclease IRE1-like [Daphnia carinata]